MITMGVDLGGRKAALSLLDDEHHLATHALTVPKTQRHTELSWLCGGIKTYTRLADLIVVEEPVIGRGVQSSLQVAHTFGAVLATIGETHPHTNVVTVSVASWKKAVVGKGNASKEEVRCWLEQAYPAYAVLCGSDQDRIDATCIGLYGVQLHERASQLAEL